MATDPEHRGALKTFLASIATISGDLSNITAPPFVLAKKSTVELPSSWAERPSVLCAPAKEQDPQKRALGVLRWYLSSLKSQQYTGGGEEDGIKKPLNAFLGELFVGQFQDDAGVTKLVSEQVSHHPPVTACYLWNEEHGIRAEGYTAPEITISKTATIRVNQVGHAFVHIDAYKEAHLVTLPTLTIKGLLSGTPYPELVGTTYITSSSGFTSKIDYEGKGFFSGGTKNGFKATLYQTSNPENVIYTVEGGWNDKFTFHDVKANEDIETYDTTTAPRAELQINSVDAQDSWESRKAWRGVIDAIAANDYGKTSQEKSKVEEAQRELRRREESAGTQWQPAMFNSLEEDPVFEELARGIGYEEDSARTKGFWKFDMEKASKAAPPYHGDLTPLG